MVTDETAITAGDARRRRPRICGRPTREQLDDATTTGPGRRRRAASRTGRARQQRPATQPHKANNLPRPYATNTEHPKRTMYHQIDQSERGGSTTDGPDKKNSSRTGQSAQIRRRGAITDGRDGRERRNPGATETLNTRNAPCTVRDQQVAEIAVAL